MIPCFWTEAADIVQVRLIREARTALCAITGLNHEAQVVIGEAPARWREEDGAWLLESLPLLPLTDPRWPAQCSCGYVFRSDDLAIMGQRELYRAPVPGLFTQDRLPVGALWSAGWALGCSDWVGPDGLALMCQTPGGVWHVDGVASNCAHPHKLGETPRRHYCWERTGDPRKPATLTIVPPLRISGHQISVTHGYLRSL